MNETNNDGIYLFSRLKSSSEEYFDTLLKYLHLWDNSLQGCIGS